MLTNIGKRNLKINTSTIFVFQVVFLRGRVFSIHELYFSIRRPFIYSASFCNLVWGRGCVFIVVNIEFIVDLFIELLDSSCQRISASFMMHMFMSQVVVYYEVVKKGSKKYTSIQKHDHKIQKLESITFLKIHNACHKFYTKSDSIKTVLKTFRIEPTQSISGLLAILWSSVPKFDLKNRYFFCTDLIDEQFRKNKKKK